MSDVKVGQVWVDGSDKVTVRLVEDGYVVVSRGGNARPFVEWIEEFTARYQPEVRPHSAGEVQS